MRMNPPGSDDPFNGDGMQKFLEVDKEFYIDLMDKIELENRLG